MVKVWSVVVASVVAVVLMVVGVAWWLGADDEPQRTGDADPSSLSPTLSTATTGEPERLAVAPRQVLRRDPTYFDCSEPARRPFTPVRISIQGVTKGSAVLPLARDGNNVPGVPPISTVGKYQFAFDAPGVHPGSAAGNVLMNAHTWPDGTAMGNRMLAKLHEGNRLVLHGAPGQGICYEVTERLEVPVDNAPLERVYDVDGPPQVVMIVCSGTRLGPGNWSHRMLWFASPVTG